MVRAKSIFFALSNVFVTSEFIVQFTGYYSTGTRSNYLNRIFQSLNLTFFEIVVRHNAMERYPSDFDIVRVNINEQILRALRRHPLIRAVNPHRRIIRHLHFSSGSSFLLRFDRIHFAFPGANDEQVNGPKRKLHRSPPNHIRIAETLQAPKLWKMGHRGEFLFSSNRFDSSYRWSRRWNSRRRVRHRNSRWSSAFSEHRWSDELDRREKRSWQYDFVRSSSGSIDWLSFQPLVTVCSLPESSEATKNAWALPRTFSYTFSKFLRIIRWESSVFIRMKVNTADRLDFLHVVVSRCI